MEPIKLTEDLRIVDLDEKQYAVQQRVNGKNGGTWASIAFCVTLPALARTSRGAMASEAAAGVRRDVYAAFERDGKEELIMALPAKIRKKVA